MEVVLKIMGKSPGLLKQIGRRKNGWAKNVSWQENLLVNFLEVSVKGSSCRGRAKANYIRELVEELGSQSYAELQRSTRGELLKINLQFNY